MRAFTWAMSAYLCAVCLFMAGMFTVFDLMLDSDEPYGGIEVFMRFSALFAFLAIAVRPAK